jgi:hypothetical protein
LPCCPQRTSKGAAHKQRRSAQARAVRIFFLLQGSHPRVARPAPPKRGNQLWTANVLKLRIPLIFYSKTKLRINQEG